jgi:hypothetical protein
MSFSHSRNCPDFIDTRKIGLLQARSAFYVVRETLPKLGLHAGNVKFSTQNEE